MNTYTAKFSNQKKSIKGKKKDFILWFSFAVTELVIYPIVLSLFKLFNLLVVSFFIELYARYFHIHEADS